MVFNATFNNILAISFIGGGNGVPGENHWPAASHWQTLSHNVVPNWMGLHYNWPWLYVP